MKYVSRSDWGAKYGRGPTNVSPERGGVAVHWEGPRMGAFSHSSCDDKVRGIERFHVESNGWEGIAYTLVVCSHGYVFEGRGLGRRTAANGTNDANQRYYAICALIGEGDAVPDALLGGIRDGIAYLREHGAGRDIAPHSEFVGTRCPGLTLTTEIQRGGFDRAEEDDMPYSKAELTAIVRDAVWDAPMTRMSDSAKNTPAHQVTRYAELHGGRLRTMVAELSARVAAQGKVLESLAAGRSVTAEEITAAAEEGARRAIAASVVAVVDVDELDQEAAE